MPKINWSDNLDIIGQTSLSPGLLGQHGVLGHQIFPGISDTMELWVLKIYPPASNKVIFSGNPQLHWRVITSLSRCSIGP